MDVLRLTAVTAALLVAACTATEGDVLTSIEADAAAVADAPPELDAGGCPTTPTCPTPPVGDIGVCGQLLDLENSAPVLVDAPSVRIFDLDDFRADPLGAIALAQIEPDECGFFATTIDGDPGLVVVHTGEVSGIGPYRRVTTAVATAPSTTVRVAAWGLRRETDEAWSNAAGLIGLSFAERGALMPIYVDTNQPSLGPLQGMPVAGVAMTAGGNPVSTDFYFSDTDPTQRTTLDSNAVVTGANGAAIAPLASTVFSFSGDRAGCTFGQGQTVIIPSAVQVQELAGTCN
ncbi:MAG TPA: hypothetical protein VML75_02430 [Kofleriaceae bacterium]|nr:hypothetical protein [Kofleriaceae bacterium]